MALVFAVMHLHTFLIASAHSYFLFKLFFFKPGIDKSTKRSTIPACPSLMCFFNKGNIEGTNSSKILFLRFVYVFSKFVLGLILWILDKICGLMTCVQSI